MSGGPFFVSGASARRVHRQDAKDAKMSKLPDPLGDLAVLAV
jgi:hypothetical protein